MKRNVEMVAENPFKGLTGKIVSEKGNRVEVLIKVNETQEFKYVGSIQDVKVLESV